VATYDPQSNIIRLVIPYKTSYYHPKPGTFYFLHVLNDTRFWESHPFTMAHSSSIHHQISQRTGEDSPLLQDEEDDILVSEVKEVIPSMTFLIRPYDSFTSRLKSAAANCWPEAASLRVLVEGPYGHTQPFDQFNNVLFIVGGSGIVVPLTYLHSLISSVRTRSVRVVWAVRELDFAEDIIQRDFSRLTRSKKLSLKIYITHCGNFGDDLQGTIPKSATVRYGRPNVRNEVESTITSVTTGSLAVVSCGPAAMADQTRRAVVDMLGTTGPSVEYFEESFKW
jgi:predicted ferric reductase